MQPQARCPAPSPGSDQPAHTHRRPSSLVLRHLLDQLVPGCAEGGGLWSTRLYWVQPGATSAHLHLTGGKQALDLQSTLSPELSGAPPQPLLPLCRALGAAGLPWTHQGREERHKAGGAAIQVLGGEAWAPQPLPSSQLLSPPLPASSRARSHCPSSCPRAQHRGPGRGRPLVSHRPVTMEAVTNFKEKMEASSGGHRKRDGEQGRRGAFDARHVCGAEYD